MHALRLAVALVITAAALPAAQWLKYPTPNIPRTADGRPLLGAPAPRSSDGKPVIEGLWRPSPGLAGNIMLGMERGEEVPYRPWAKALFDERTANDTRDDPTARCVVGGVPRSDFVPYPLKILQTPGLVVILYEAIHSYRQIFTDGRELPKGPNPQWFGYSVGRWEGDVFVVQSAGFNDDVWLDNAGRPATSQLRVTERFTRRDFGRMDIVITIDDPKAYTRPWNVTQQLSFLPDTEILEYMCNENNKYFDIIPKAKPGSPARP
jgi:hypothetical protein